MLTPGISLPNQGLSLPAPGYFSSSSSISPRKSGLDLFAQTKKDVYSYNVVPQDRLVDQIYAVVMECEIEKAKK